MSPKLWIASPAIKRRLPFAVRAGICCGLPVVAGWYLHDVHAGLLGTIGAFTALYGSDRPYSNRALHLALVAVSLALSVALGIIVEPYHWFAVAFVALFAAVATFLCSALRVSAPGAYMFALACASGTSLPAGVNLGESTLYVLGGGLVCWMAHMVGALRDHRGPERAAVISAAEAVAQFCNGVGTVDRAGARHAASQALNGAWTILMTFQPADRQPDAALEALRQNTVRLHALFFQALDESDIDRANCQFLATQAEAISVDSANRSAQRSSDIGLVAHRQSFTSLTALRDALSLWSIPTVLAIRVGIGTFIAGAIGLLFSFSHAYWGMAAVVVVLNQSYGWPGTPRRAVYRVMGTLTGLLLSWGVIATHPVGVRLALTVAVLQFLIEMWVVHQYAIAAIFITANSLTIAAASEDFAGVAHLLADRGIETVIGCTVALAIFAIAVPRSAFQEISTEILRTLQKAQRVLECMATRNAIDVDFLDSRRELQRHAIALQQIFDSDGPALGSRSPVSTRTSAVVVATQGLAYRILNACWDAERRPGSGEQARARATACAEAGVWLDAVANRIRRVGGKERGEEGSATENLEPGFLAAEIRALDVAIRQMR